MTKAQHFAVAAALLCGTAFGQVITGGVSGTVRDSSGAVLPGTSIQIQNADTGVGRTIETDANEASSK